MNLKRAFAIFKKQLKDTLKNKTVLIQFLMFPVMTFVMSAAIQDETMPSGMFAVMFAPMYVGMSPLVSTCAIIAEEKETNTLRTLIMANVKPMEYLLGVGSYVFLLCGLASLAFCFLAEFSGISRLLFYISMLFGIMISILLGAGLGMLSKNQMSATSLSLPFMLVLSFFPMIAMFNKMVGKLSCVLYTQQLMDLAADPSPANFTWDRLLILGGNLLIGLLIFLIAYRKRGLQSE